MLYQLSYFRNTVNGVGKDGFEPPKAYASRFTVCPIWPLWNLPFPRTQSAKKLQPTRTGLETAAKLDIIFYVQNFLTVFLFSALFFLVFLGLTLQGFYALVYAFLKRVADFLGM